LRFCPSLAKKPTPKNGDAKQQKKTDPFANPPEPLFITSIPSSNPTHILVLNKFPIIAGHFILATKSNKKQTHVLEQDDLEATYACLKAWQTEQGSKQQRLFAFFNSGDHSGASQPHRHLQFLPVESMHHGEATSSWDLLMDIVLSGKNAPNQGKLSAPTRTRHEQMGGFTTNV
jgi:ATP adenylyltransferase